jgi:hypothetical protein
LSNNSHSLDLNQKALESFKKTKKKKALELFFIDFFRSAVKCLWLCILRVLHSRKLVIYNKNRICLDVNGFTSPRVSEWIGLEI